MKTRVAVIDDDPINRETICQLLTNSRDFDPCPSALVSHALEFLRLERRKPLAERYAVAIIDLKFVGQGIAEPENAGFDILHEALQDDFLEAIIHTGTGNEERAARALNEGARCYITRSSNVGGKIAGEQILDAVRSAVESRAELCASYEAIHRLSAELDRLKSSVIGPPEWISHCEETLEALKQAYRSLRKARRRGADV